MNMLNKQQISNFEEQCGYVSILMNRSKAVRYFIRGIIYRILLFMFACLLVKWNDKFLGLLIIYSIYFIIVTYRGAFGCLRKQMINNLDKARIVGSGVIIDKAHKYPEGLIGHIRRHSKDDQTRRYKYESALELSFRDGITEWYSCTDITYEQAVIGGTAVVVEFPEEYELGKYCCFLDKDNM